MDIKNLQKVLLKSQSVKPKDVRIPPKQIWTCLLYLFLLYFVKVFFLTWMSCGLCSDILTTDYCFVGFCGLITALMQLYSFVSSWLWASMNVLTYLSWPISAHRSATRLQPQGAGSYLLCRPPTFKPVYYKLDWSRYGEGKPLVQGPLQVDVSER